VREAAARTTRTTGKPSVSLKFSGEETWRFDDRSGRVDIVASSSGRPPLLQRPDNPWFRGGRECRFHRGDAATRRNAEKNRQTEKNKRTKNKETRRTNQTKEKQTKEKQTKEKQTKEKQRNAANAVLFSAFLCVSLRLRGELF
jgi:hypothetical protein